MSCSDARDLLVPWLDGELPPDDAPRVSGHVARCPVCQRKVELHRRVGSTLDALYASRPGVDLDVTPQVRRRLAASSPLHSLRGTPAATALRVVLGVAASILIAFGSWWLVSSPSGAPAAGEDPSVAVGVPAEEELLENLDVLEALDEEGIDLTPELVRVLLDDDGAVDDDELDEIFEYVLEEEVLSDQL